MVTAMTAYKHSKKSLYLLGALLLAACQPSPSNSESAVAENEAAIDTPLVITSDSVTMTPDHILSVKPSRYQPSLGLQGNIEPIKQTSFVAVHPITIEKTLVSEGQWVEKGAPLLVFRRVGTANDVASTDNDTAANAIKDPTLADKQQVNTNSNTKAVQPTKDKDIAVAKETTNNVKSPATDSTTAKADDIANSNDADSNNANNSGSTNNESDSNSVDDSAATPSGQYNLITIHASFSGRVENLNAKAGQKMIARASLLQLSDETKLHFVATLPIQAEPQLSVGQTVNFTVESMTDKFTGQVSKLVPTSQPKKLLVYVNVIDNEASRDKLLPEMKVTGRVNYGQIDVGTIVPKRALHDVDLTELQKPPYMPLRPLAANVWVIGQDQRLTRQPIEVVEYDPTTQQYLIAGVSNDSLICLADLPVDSEGKRVIVS